ncbi:hypothetical protein APSETT444_009348 [Aspergillus pseudonomiae]
MASQMDPGWAGKLCKVYSVGNGMNTATAPIWQTETAQAKWRGKLVIFELGLNVGGYCIVNWINYGLSFHEGPIAWRLPIALQLVLVIMLFLTVPWLPESPRWLIAHNRHEEAAEVLACIEGMSIDDPYITTQHNEIRFSIQYERDNAVRWRDLLLRRQSDGTKTLRRLLLGAGTQAIQQLQANRTLEDVDAYYRSNPPLIVAGDSDATSTKRPLRFIQHEDSEVQRRTKRTDSLSSKSDEFASAEHVG